jgi:DnaJ-domain-containing protein 1
VSAESLGKGDFVRLVYRLGRGAATGVLSIHAPWQRPEVLVLRRGALVTTEADVHGRVAGARLARLAAMTGNSATFDGGAAQHPPGARGLPMAAWARQHLEAQLDQARADALTVELAGARIAVRPDHAPDGAVLDEADRRMLAAMAQPRRLDQIWPLARTPRFRLLSFIHFLDATGALQCDGVAAPVVVHTRTDSEAHRTLGVSGDADRDAVKRAYRRLARALHPDLHPEASDERRRSLERKMADVTDAYRALRS